MTSFAPCDAFTRSQRVAADEDLKQRLEAALHALPEHDDLRDRVKRLEGLVLKLNRKQSEQH